MRIWEIPENETRFLGHSILDPFILFCILYASNQAPSIRNSWQSKTYIWKFERFKVQRFSIGYTQKLQIENPAPQFEMKQKADTHTLTEQSKQTRNHHHHRLSVCFCDSNWLSGWFYVNVIICFILHSDKRVSRGQNELKRQHRSTL